MSQLTRRLGERGEELDRFRASAPPREKECAPARLRPSGVRLTRRLGERGEELDRFLGGETSLGEVYLPSDPPRMFKVIQSTRKPCLAYKVLAAGRRVDSAGQVRQCFETAFKNIKPSDALIVGMYQQLSDQVGDNAAIVREICSRQEKL